MTWHLKDRELEEALNKKSHPMHTFTDELNKKMARIPKEQLPRVLGTEVTFQRIGTDGVILEGNVLQFSIEEIENTPEYNPKYWNEYPTVTPPEGVLMRVECDGNLHTALIFKDNRWQFESGENFQGFERIYKVRRYRPWEDS